MAGEWLAAASGGVWVRWNSAGYKGASAKMTLCDHVGGLPRLACETADPRPLAERAAAGPVLRCQPRQVPRTRQHRCDLLTDSPTDLAVTQTVAARSASGVVIFGADMPTRANRGEIRPGRLTTLVT